MTEAIASQSAGPTASTGVLARAVGILFSPRTAYGKVAAQPRVLGALVAVIAISAVATFWFLSTEVGRRAALEQQLSWMASLGAHPTATQLEQIERRVATSGVYVAVASQIVAIPLISLIIAGIGAAVFTAALGGTATFIQVYAVVVHSWFIPAVVTVLVMPLNYVRGSLTGATALAVFFPMLDDGSFTARLLGSIDLVRIWWIMSLAIGFGVLYKRRTGPIAGVLLALYAAIAVLVAAVSATLSGV